MDYAESAELYDIIKKSGAENDEDWQMLLADVLEDAVKYAQIRADWHFMTDLKRAEADSGRTIHHNAFLSSLHALARYAQKRGYDVSWKTALERDRKDLGDFACYIHYALSIASR